MRPSKSALLSLSVAAALGVTGLSASGASADVAGLSVSQVGYNAYGSDTYYNRNQEFVDVKASADTDVKGLVVADAWGKAHLDDNPRKCNTYKVVSLPGVAETDGKVVLPAGHTLRVYTGRGLASVSGTVHSVYLDSRCGYHGHIWGNGGDTAWVVLGAASSSFSYDFDNGYTVKP